jgi:hypothetical protein
MPRLALPIITKAGRKSVDLIRFLKINPRQITEPGRKYQLSYNQIVTMFPGICYLKENDISCRTRKQHSWPACKGHLKGAVIFPMEPTPGCRNDAGLRQSKLSWGRTRIAPSSSTERALLEVRSDSAARVAVKLGYKNVYRDPYGYPEWQGRGLPVDSAPAGLAQPGEAPKAHGPLYGWAMIWTLLGIFVGGMALNLTPCIYPLIPITISYFGGQAAKEGEGQGKLVAHGLCYMMGLAVTNSALGVVASLTGGLMGAMLQNTIVLIIVAAVLIVFATSLFGLWEISLVIIAFNLL